tara:strand:- start:527 stop:1585 length:1059 start_codon:yes stop_codon:yes gene_type:complete
MSLSANDIVFRWVNPQFELGGGNDNAPTVTSVHIPGNTLIQSIPRLIQSKAALDRARQGINITIRITRATYNLRSSGRKKISVEEYLSPTMGAGGQYSGWLEFRSAKLKDRLLNCTKDHFRTFGGKNRKLVYFPFVDCLGQPASERKRRINLELARRNVCHYPFDLKVCKVINGLNAENEFPQNAIQHISGLNPISNFDNQSSPQFINPQPGLLKYASLGSLMPMGHTNNCEINFVGDINIPVLILEIEEGTAGKFGIPNYTLYDLVLEQIGIDAYKMNYEPWGSNDNNNNNDDVIMGMGGRKIRKRKKTIRRKKINKRRKTGKRKNSGNRKKTGKRKKIGKRKKTGKRKNK